LQKSVELVHGRGYNCYDRLDCSYLIIKSAELTFHTNPVYKTR
jgi:hypothetical protein